MCRVVVNGVDLSVAQIGAGLAWYDDRFGRDNQLCPPVAGIGDSGHEPVILQILHQLRHCLLGHLGALCEQGDCRSVVIEVLEDRPMCRTNDLLTPFSEPNEDQVVESDERLSHQNGQVGRTGAPESCRNSR